MITDEIIRLAEKSIVVLRIITGTLLTICIYHWIKQIPLPYTLAISWYAVLGYWFPTLWRVMRK